MELMMAEVEQKYSFFFLFLNKALVDTTYLNVLDLCQSVLLVWEILSFFLYYRTTTTTVDTQTPICVRLCDVKNFK